MTRSGAVELPAVMSAARAALRDTGQHQRPRADAGEGVALVVERDSATAIHLSDRLRAATGCVVWRAETIDGVARVLRTHRVCAAIVGQVPTSREIVLATLAASGARVTDVASPGSEILVEASVSPDGGVDTRRTYSGFVEPRPPVLASERIDRAPGPGAVGILLLDAVLTLTLVVSLPPGACGGVHPEARRRDQTVVPMNAVADGAEYQEVDGRATLTVRRPTPGIVYAIKWESSS